MTALMYNKTANLALISLFSKSPNEILAVAAECRLLEEACNKLVILDVEYSLLSQRPSPHMP